MATNTYVALATANGTGSSTTISFTGIPSTYTDLVIRGSYSSTAGAGFNVTLNNVTTNTSYSTTRITFSGGSAASYRQSNQNQFSLNYNGSFSTTPDTSVIEIDFFDYANTTTYKTMLAKYGNTTTDSGPVVGHWRGSTGSATEAINRIDLIAAGGGNWTTGTTFSLYGILREGVSPAPKATGGAIYDDETYYYHAFGASGTFTPTQSLTADVLVIAGGGGGGSDRAGGGGAGGYRSATGLSLASGTGITVTVGAGGTGGASGSGNAGAKGSNSVFSTITSTGGGFGASVATGGAGGSGGGAYGQANYFGGAGNEGGFTPAEGFAGGNSLQVSSTYSSGGGGGAGGVGGNATSNALAGVGGIGSNAHASWASAVGIGVSGYLAGGGGGAGDSSPAQIQFGVAGGLGGGGAGGAGGGTAQGARGQNAVQSTGSGGGGSGNISFAAGGNGGSGVVIVRYAKV